MRRSLAKDEGRSWTKLEWPREGRPGYVALMPSVEMRSCWLTSHSCHSGSSGQEFRFPRQRVLIRVCAYMQTVLRKPSG